MTISTAQKAQKIAFVVFAACSAISIGSAWVTISQLEKLREKGRRDAAAAEYANACIRDKIFAGGYSGMTHEEIDAQVREDYAFFTLTGRDELDSELGTV